MPATLRDVQVPASSARTSSRSRPRFSGSGDGDGDGDAPTLTAGQFMRSALGEALAGERRTRSSSSSARSLILSDESRGWWIRSDWIALAWCLGILIVAATAAIAMFRRTRR